MIIQKWGIVRTVFGDDESPDFLVEVGSNLGTIKIAETSKAVTKSKLLIKQESIDNISVPSDGNWYWVKISHQYLPYEDGECSISTSGKVTGVGTSFTDILRDQQTEVPVKIKFYSDSGTDNDQVYEVVSIEDDENMVLTGAGTFVAESGLKYYVIGSTPIGESLTDSQLEGLYQYDSCLIEFIAEENEDVSPVTDYIEDEEFYIARVKNVSGTVTVQDKREDQFITFNVEGMDDKMDKSSNLSDVEDVSEARDNLDVYSKTEVDLKTSFDKTVVTSYSLLNSYINSISVRAVSNGKQVVVSGKFYVTHDISASSVLFTMALSAYGENGTLLAGCTMAQPGSWDNGRAGAMQVVKNSSGLIPYVQFEVPEDSKLYSCGDNQPYYFNLTWLI